MPSDKFIKLMDELKELHNKKSNDYAQFENPFSNFERSASLASWFDNPIDKIFTTLLGIKLARIAELRNNAKIPNNESIDDSLKDFVCYAGLWASYWLTYKSEPIYNQGQMIAASSEELKRIQEQYNNATIKIDQHFPQMTNKK